MLANHLATLHGFQVLSWPVSVAVKKKHVKNCISTTCNFLCVCNFTNSQCWPLYTPSIEISEKVTRKGPIPMSCKWWIPYFSSYYSMTSVLRICTREVMWCLTEYQPQILTICGLVQLYITKWEYWLIPRWQFSHQSIKVFSSIKESQQKF